MTRTRITLTLAIILLVASLLLAVTAIRATGFFTTGSLVSILSLFVLGIILATHVMGWRYSAEALVLAAMVLTGISSSPELVRESAMISVLVPAVLAAILLSPFWILPIFATTLLLVILRVVLSNGGNFAELGPTFSAENIILMSLVIIGTGLAGAVARTAQQEAEAHAAQAQAAQAEAQANALALEEQMSEADAARIAAEAARIALSDQITTIIKQREVIREMSVPVLPITARALLMPLVGALDSERIRVAQDRALDLIQRQRGVQYLLLDITGVPIVDSQVAGGLIQLVHATRLLGAEVIVVGIRPEVAQTVVGLGLDLSIITTRSSLQEGVSYVSKREAKSPVL